MGCGALGGSTTLVSQSTSKSKMIFSSILSDLKPNNQLFTSSRYQSIIRDFQLNPSNYLIKPNHKLQLNECFPTSIKQKWKLILYGLDLQCPLYINCLSYSQNNQKQLFISCQNQQQKSESQNKIKLPPIFLHDAFVQIQKDKGRTFKLNNIQEQIFSRTLKRIACFFPKMGYTQGINFLVCYLIKIGYSQQDVFWIFVHMALNRKYMILGLFQDGFPLSCIYHSIFENMLKRESPLVYHHFYEKLLVNEHLWVFKWFTTYYLYSFPFQMGKYAWNFIIQNGGVSIVTFAVALIKILQMKLLTLQDDNEISLFFNELKQLETFNNYVNLQHVLRYAYSLNIKDSDCKDLNIQNQKPYAQYIAYLIKIEHIKRNKINLNDQIIINGKKFSNLKEIQNRMNQIIEQWYKDLIENREQFINLNGMSNQQRINKMRTSVLISSADHEEISIQIHNQNKKNSNIRQIKLQDQNHIVGQRDIPIKCPSNQCQIIQCTNLTNQLKIFNKIDPIIKNNHSFLDFTASLTHNSQQESIQRKSKLLATGQLVLANLSNSYATISNNSQNLRINQYNKNLCARKCVQNKINEYSKKKSKRSLQHTPQDILDIKYQRKAIKFNKNLQCNKILYMDNVRTPIYQKWTINSSSPGNINFSQQRQRQTVSYEKQLFHRQLFKKKNKKNSQANPNIRVMNILNSNQHENFRQSLILLIKIMGQHANNLTNLIGYRTIL